MLSTWLEQQGRRLDCGPYLSGAMEAKALLERLPVRRIELRELTCGHNGGIYNGPLFVRNYVSDPEHGIPFVTSSTMLLAEFTHVDLLRRSDATSSRLSYLRLSEGMTLISCSGTIGRMAYARPEMSDVWSSQDVLKVVPDSDAVRPGYLYAFLSGPFGVPLVVGATYGAIIQHIEPEHIADVPVPLAPDAVQEEAHRLVTEASELRTWASGELRAVVREIEVAAGLAPLDVRYAGARPDTALVRANTLRGRMDGLFHSHYHRSALEPLLDLPASRRTTAGDLVTRVFEPNRFKRVQVEDAGLGVPFFGTAELMRADPEYKYLVAKRTAGISDLMVGRTTVLVPRSGQLVGIIGHAALPHGDILNGAVSEHAIRVIAPDNATAGYVFACLSSEYARRQLKSRAYGSSIPSLDEARVSGVVLPRLDDDRLKALGLRAFAVRAARHEAVGKEREARSLVEHWIERQGAA